MDGIMQLPLGPLASNCYIVPGENNTALVVDPAASEEVIAVLEREGLSLGGIVITHGHFDHFAGVAALKEQSGATVYAPELDAEMLESYDKSWAWFMQGTPFSPIKADRLFNNGDTFEVSGVKLRVMGSPGHTAGSCLLFCEQYGVIFTGDALFKNGVGRTDGYSGSTRQQMESLAEIRKVEGDYKLLCGHGETTTLLAEKELNPYLNNKQLFDY